MTVAERQIRLDFMRYLWTLWLKTANLAPLMVSQPNVAYSRHLQGDCIAWKCLIDTNRPQSLMTAKALSLYLRKMVDDFYLLVPGIMQATLQEYQRLNGLATDLNCDAIPLVEKEAQGVLSYAESLKLSAYRLKYSQLFEKAQKCAYVLSWTKFEVVDAMKNGDCLVFKIETF